MYFLFQFYDRNWTYSICLHLKCGDPLTQPIWINSSPLLFRLSLKWQDHYHEGQLLPLGNICMSASLSSSSSISICHHFIVLFSCFLIPHFILPDTLVLSLILSLCGGWKRMDKLRGTKRATYMKKEKSQRELVWQSFLKIDIQTLSSCHRLCRWDPRTNAYTSKSNELKCDKNKCVLKLRSVTFILSEGTKLPGLLKHVNLCPCTEPSYSESRPVVLKVGTMSPWGEDIVHLK